MYQNLKTLERNGKCPCIKEFLIFRGKMQLCGQFRRDYYLDSTNKTNIYAISLLYPIDTMTIHT